MFVSKKYYDKIKSNYGLRRKRNADRKYQEE